MYVYLALKTIQKKGRIYSTLSDFHAEKGYYIQILDDFFYSKLESNWKGRAAEFKAENGTIFRILSPIDVVSNKLLVGRSKDFDAITDMIKDGFIDREELRDIHRKLTTEKPKLAHKISIVNEALDIRIERSQAGFTKKLADFIDKYQNTAEGFDLALGVLGIQLPGDNPTPPAMEAAEKHLNDKLISGETVIQRLEKLCPAATKRALARDKYDK